MQGVSPVRLLENDPVPLPSVDFVSATVGLAFMLQHTPLDVTGAPPSDVTFPPPEALLMVMEETEPVVTSGRVEAGGVVADTVFE